MELAHVVPLEFYDEKGPIIQDLESVVSFADQVVVVVQPVDFRVGMCHCLAGKAHSVSDFLQEYVKPLGDAGCDWSRRRTNVNVVQHLNSRD